MTLVMVSSPPLITEEAAQQLINATFAPEVNVNSAGDLPPPVPIPSGSFVGTVAHILEPFRTYVFKQNTILAFPIAVNTNTVTYPSGSPISLRMDLGASVLVGPAVPLSSAFILYDGHGLPFDQVVFEQGCQFFNFAAAIPAFNVFCDLRNLSNFATNNWTVVSFLGGGGSIQADNVIALRGLFVADSPEIKISDANQMDVIGCTFESTVGLAKPYLRVSGNASTLNIVNSPKMSPLTGESCIRISPLMNNTLVNVSNNPFVSRGGTFYSVGSSGNITSIINNGGNPQMQSTGHGLSTGSEVYISGNNPYRSKGYTVTVIDGNNFTINTAYTAGGTGEWISDSMNEASIQVSSNFNGEANPSRLFAKYLNNGTGFTTTFGAINTYTDLIHTIQLQPGCDCQRFVFSPTGVITYVGKRTEEVSVLFSIQAKSSLGLISDYRFAMKRNGVIDTTQTFTKSFSNKDETFFTFFTFKCSLNDELQFVVKNESTTNSLITAEDQIELKRSGL